MSGNGNYKIKKNNKLKLKDVCFAWSDKENLIINNCSFSILEQGLFMIVGKNGCGKSTLIKLIQGIINPTKGLLEAPSNVSIVFQNPDHQILMPTCRSELILNIRENISKKEIDQKVMNTLFAVGLQGYINRPVHTLSGGQKQRLAIASALIRDSDFVVMDEPTALLDEFSQKQIINLIKSLTDNKVSPITVLWITHRLEELIYADQVSTMHKGRILGWQDPINFKYR